MILRQPVTQRRRQQQPLLPIHPDEVLRHTIIVLNPPDGFVRQPDALAEGRVRRRRAAGGLCFPRSCLQPNESKLAISTSSGVGGASCSPSTLGGAGSQARAASESQNGTTIGHVDHPHKTACRRRHVRPQADENRLARGRPATDVASSQQGDDHQRRGSGVYRVSSALKLCAGDVDVYRNERTWGADAGPGHSWRRGARRARTS